MAQMYRPYVQTRAIRLVRSVMPQVAGHGGGCASMQISMVCVSWAGLLLRAFKPVHHAPTHPDGGSQHLAKEPVLLWPLLSVDERQETACRKIQWTDEG